MQFKFQFQFLSVWALSGTALSDTGRCPGQRWVTNKAKQLLNVVSTLSPRHTFNSFSFHDTVLSKLQCHKIFKIPFCITIWSPYSQTSRIIQVLQMQLSDTGRCPGQRWVTQDAVRDSTEWNWMLFGTALSETGRCLGQLWVKLGAVRDSSEWFEWHSFQLMTSVFHTY